MHVHASALPGEGVNAGSCLTLPGPRTVVRGARLQRATRTSTLNAGMSYTCNTSNQQQLKLSTSVPAV
jgi:hypothetical protein